MRDRWGGRDTSELWKHGASLGIYLLAIAVAFYKPWLSLAIYCLGDGGLGDSGGDGEEASGEASTGECAD